MRGCSTLISGTPFTKQMFLRASENIAGIPGTKVTRVPVVIAAASSSVMNSGDSIFFDIARSFSLASLAFIRVVADSLSTGFDTVYEREDHLFTTHFPEYSIEEVE